MSATGFDPKFKPLDDDSMKLLSRCLLVEMGIGSLKNPSIPDDELPFLSQIIKKRVDVLKLPVTLSSTGLLAVNAFAKNPGQAVALLIDFLTKFEGKEISATTLSELYPWGFYTEDSMNAYIDDYLKPRKVKWAEIY